MLTRPVVIYHGECGFCRRWVGRLAAWDRRGALEYLALQDPRAPALAGRPRRELERAAHVVLPDGRVLEGARAFRAMCQYLPGGWIVRALLMLPGAIFVADAVYRWIARRWGPVGPSTLGD